MCQLNNFGTLSSHIDAFAGTMDAKKHKKRRTYTCKLCGKSFSSDSYLEFHLKAMHFRSEKLQAQYERHAEICPADLCDIFECPDLEMPLRDQIYMDRDKKVSDEDEPKSAAVKRSVLFEVPLRW